MELQYFGTDGIRGEAFASPLTISEVNRWGQAWASVASSNGIEELVIGWDPRVSSEALVKSFISGLGNKIRTSILGLVPTPVVAYITSIRPSAWGVMFSASHNLPHDNGIKGFNHNGEKNLEKDEAALEAAFNNTHIDTDCSILQYDILIENSYINAYLQHIGNISLPDNINLVVDCSHGATADLAALTLKGKNIHWLGVPADGTRINVGVGSSNISYLSEAVCRLNADFGIAFDGDGDRCIMVDTYGKVIDGDQLLWLFTQNLKHKNKLLPGVVGTIMSNGGLEQALTSIGVPFVRTAVGDKHMLRELAQRNWWLAAEASGHIIQKQICPSGDGLLTALTAIKILLGYSQDNRWSWKFEPWQMQLVNIAAQKYKPIKSCSYLLSTIKDLENKYTTDLRMVIRWSGTELKLRLMAEAKDIDITNYAINALVCAANIDLNKD